MKILFLGDIVGRSGRDIVSSLLYSLKEEYKPDLVIANAENSAHGKGITKRIYKELLNEGIDYITMGNHAYSKSEINNYMDELDHMVVPYNHYLRTTENYYKLITYKGIKFILTNILGQALINESNNSPYDAFKCVIEDTKHLNPDFYFVDLHAELTGEKRIFAEYFKDYVGAVIGTHTHIQTADECILNDSTAFISDVGMCGAYISALGRDIDESIKLSVFNESTRFTPATGEGILQAILIEFNNQSKKPISVKRIQIRP